MEGKTTKTDNQSKSSEDIKINVISILLGLAFLLGVFLALTGRFMILLWIIGISLSLFCLFLGIRLCFDVHAIRKHLDSKEGR